MMALNCLKYDWNHFAKENTVKCDMCSASRLYRIHDIIMKHYW